MKISNEYGYQPKKPDIKPNPPKCSSAMQEEIVKPMNPYATQDFANAVKDAMDDLKSLNKVGEHVREAFPYMDESCEMVKETYQGIVRVKATSTWRSLIEMLICEGYEVTARRVNAIETERRLEDDYGFVIIEFKEVK